MPESPSRVRWTDHAAVKAGLLSVSRTDVEQALLDGHQRRQANVGAAGWRLSVGPWVILYDHPDRDDRATARIVTLWRRR